MKEINYFAAGFYTCAGITFALIGNLTFTLLMIVGLAVSLYLGGLE